MPRRGQYVHVSIPHVDLLGLGRIPVLVNEFETPCMRDQCAAAAQAEAGVAGGLIHAGWGLRCGAGAPRTKRSG